MGQCSDAGDEIEVLTEELALGDQSNLERLMERQVLTTALKNARVFFSWINRSCNV